LKIHIKKLQTLLRWFFLASLAFSCTACEKINNKAHRLKDKLTNTQAPTPNLQSPEIAEGISTIRDIAYGTHPKQKFDVYVPEDAKNAPIIVMLHGGGWTTGDKASPLIYINKLNRWGPKGFIIVSTGTRLMPDADVYGQLQDLTQALVTIQKRAAEWGGNPTKLFLMGHSSGGTLVAALSAKPSLVTDLGGKRWLGTFVLDASSLDIERTMRLWHPDMFTYAYGKDASRWPSASPYALIDENAIPYFIACASSRPDSSYEQATLFKAKAEQFKIEVEISLQQLNHGEVNDHLGLASDYTVSAENFMRRLDSEVAKKLASE
jgi:acetyl esterase/lipase